MRLHNYEVSTIYHVTQKLHCFILAIALSELHVLRQFLAHLHFNKFSTIRVFYILYITRDGEPA